MLANLYLGKLATSHHKSRAKVKPNQCLQCLVFSYHDGMWNILILSGVS